MSEPTLPPPPSTPEQASTTDSGELAKKPWFKRWWGIILLVFGVLVIFAALTDGESADTVDDATSENDATPDDDEGPEDTSGQELGAGDADEAPDAVEDADDPVDEVSGSAQPADYEIVSVEDTGYERIDVRVVVQGTPDAETLIETAHAAVLQIRDAQPYTAAFVFLFADGDRTDDAYTLARAVDAPNGEVGDALGATPGEYSDHIVTIDAREKDWASQPSDRDNEIAAAWFPLNHRLYDEVDFDEVDEETNRRVAEEFGLTESEVADAIDRVVLWSFSGEEVTVSR